MSDIDTLAATAAASWPLVRFYPTMGGGWAAAMNAGPALTAPTLSEVVALAAECKPIPEVPRRPVRRLLKVEKDTGRSARPWLVRADGQVVCGLKTRREAEAAVEVMGARLDAQSAEWDQAWGALVSTGVEGETFKWRR